MKKISQFASIIISYIANAVLLFGDILLMNFLIESNKVVEGSEQLGQGLGLAVIVMIAVIVLFAGLIAKIITLPATIKFFVDAIKKQGEHYKRWFIVHLVDYIIFIALIVFAVVVIIIR